MFSIFIFILSLIFPFAIVALNVNALTRNGRRGLNVKCAIGALLYGISVVIGYGLRSLFDSANDFIRFYILSVSAALSFLSAVFALWGMYEMRRRRNKWHRGWKRAIWSFWLGIVNLCTIAFYFYLSTHPDLFERIQRAVQ